jgi:signal transduction histidine kinase/ActR/RegA family two-component response regulator
MDTQPAEQSVKRWPVRAAPPKAAQTASVDPTPSSVSPIRGARVPWGVLWLFVPTVLLLLGSAYWLSTLWAHALIQREAEATAAIVQPELQRVPFARVLDSKQRERADWRWQEELTRLAVSLPRMGRVTVWDSNGKVIWSQDQRRNDSQPMSAEVRQALLGKVLAQMTEGSLLPGSSAPDGSAGVVEVFVPVRGQDKSSVLGVIGLSQRNDSLEAGIVEGQRFVWGVAAGGGLLLTLALVLAVITTSRRYAGHVKSLRTQLSQRAKTVESTSRRLQEALETSERGANELNRLLEVAEDVGAAVTEEELYGTVAQAAARACGVDRCSILLRHSADESLVPVTRRFAEETGNRRMEGLPDSLPSLGLDTLPRVIVDVVQRQQPAVISEEGDEQTGSPSWLKLFQARSALVVPLVHQGKTAGVLSLEHLHEARAFSQHQIQLATTLATQAAAALDKARLYQEIAQRLRQTETLLAVMKILASTLDFTEAVRQTIREIVRALGADMGGVWVAGGSEQLGFVAGYHVPPDLRSSVADTSVSMQDDVIKRLKRIEGPIYATNSRADHRFNHPLTRLIAHKSLVLQPIQGAEDLVGFLALAWVGERHAFKNDEISLLAGTGRQLAVAVQLRRTQEQVSRQERLNALGQMASGIAHDFNNALVPIAGYTDILLDHPDQLKDTQKTLRCLRLIQTGVRDAASVVSRLREFYRRRKDSDKFQPVELNQMVEQVIDLTRPKWRDEALARGCTIEMRAELEPIPSVLGSASELREMLTNLIFNALDAMPKGGTITIKTLRAHPAPETGGDRSGAPSERVSLEVSDTGVGMTEDTRQRCLEPFFSTKGERGSGLGLAMVYGTVKRHRGTLDLNSAVGAGTRVTLCFPAESATEAQAPRRSALPARSLDVLVVDDEPMVRDVMALYLTGDGHRVQTASNGHEGLEQFKAGHFDVVLTDQAMPGLNGGELAGLIKALAPTVPVILITGFGDILEATDGQPAGVDLILTKPVSIAVLRETLAELTAQPGETPAQAH